MASIATVVTMGYGSWGGVNLLPTLGYGIGEPPEVVIGSIVIGAVESRPRISVSSVSIPTIDIGDVSVLDSGIGIGRVSVE